MLLRLPRYKSSINYADQNFKMATATGRTLTKWENELDFFQCNQKNIKIGWNVFDSTCRKFCVNLNQGFCFLLIKE